MLSEPLQLVRANLLEQRNALYGKPAQPELAAELEQLQLGLDILHDIDRINNQYHMMLLLRKGVGEERWNSKR